MPYDILGLGCVAVDESLVLERFPTEDSKSRIIGRSTAVGGTTATALLAAAKLGASCAYAGTLGDDSASRLVLAAFHDAGIDTSLIRRDPAARPIRCTILTSQATGSRTVLYNLDGAVPAAAGWPPEVAIRAAKLLLVDQFGRDGIIPATKVAKAAGFPVVLDLEHANSADEYLELFALADHVVLTRELAAQITGHTSPVAAVDQLWQSTHRAIIVTAGADGLWYRCAADAQVRHLPAYAVTARDTTGCGDVFRGAYAAALVQGQSVEGALRYGAAAATLRAAAITDDERLPTPAAVLQLIATRPAMS
jgi:sulfofructose kinase